LETNIGTIRPTGQASRGTLSHSPARVGKSASEDYFSKPAGLVKRVGAPDDGTPGHCLSPCLSLTLHVKGLASGRGG